MKMKSTRSNSNPTPTFWIEKTPDGIPPAGVLLWLYGTRDSDEYESGVFIISGFYSDKLGLFLNSENIAIEEDSTVTHYHIVHTPDGDIFSLR